MVFPSPIAPERSNAPFYSTCLRQQAITHGEAVSLFLRTFTPKGRVHKKNPAFGGIFYFPYFFKNSSIGMGRL